MTLGELDPLVERQREVDCDCDQPDAPLSQRLWNDSN